MDFVTPAVTLHRRPGSCRMPSVKADIRGKAPREYEIHRSHDDDPKRAAYVDQILRLRFKNQ